jgi:hypothetical protein
MNNPFRVIYGPLAALLSALPCARANDATTIAAWVPPTPAVAAAAGLLPPDAVLPPGHHNVLEGMAAKFGLTPEQELWIEPQLHAEESVTKPILHYKALGSQDQQRILLIIKVAARLQIRTLLTPSQQLLMDKEIESVKASAAKKISG